MDDRQRQYEENLSAIMDGELHGEELLLSIDALAENGDLRRFWRDGRSMQKALAIPARQPAEVPPEHVWNRIQEKSEPHTADTAKVIPLRKVPPQVWAVAASIVLVFSLTLAGLFRGVTPDSATAETTVELGSKQMTEDRCVAITRELLMADSRWHRKMLEVMQTVDREVYRSRGDARAEESLTSDESVSQAGNSIEEDQIAGAPATDQLEGETDVSSEQLSRRGDDVRINLW